MVYLIVDGLRWAELWEALNGFPPGEADALAEVFGAGLSRSVYFTRTHSVFPTVTFAANASLATGVYPAEHGIPGNRFLLRRTGESVSLAEAAGVLDVYRQGLADALLRAPTVYRAIKGESIVSFHMYGAGSDWVVPSLGDSLLYLSSPARFDHVATARLLQRLESRFAETGRLPRVLTLYWPGLDETSHYDGVSAQREYLLGPLNGNLRVLLHGVPETGLPGLDRYSPDLSSFVFVLTADHGMTPAKRWIAWGEVRQALFRNLGHVGPFSGLSGEDLADLVRVEPNGASAHVYLRRPGQAWETLLSDDSEGRDLLERLGGLLAGDELLRGRVDPVLSRSGGGDAYRACSAGAGCADFAEFIQGAAQGDPALAGLRAQERLAGLGRFGGDLVLLASTAGAWGFLGPGNPEWESFAAIHGNLLSPAETWVPLVVAGAEIAPGSLDSLNGILDGARLVAALAGSPLPGLPAPDLGEAAGELVVTSTGPVDLGLSAPSGATIDGGRSEVPGGTYQVGAEASSWGDRIVLRKTEAGEYRLRVAAERTAPAGAFYTLRYRLKGEPHTLAAGAPVPGSEVFYALSAPDLPPEFLSVLPIWAEVGEPYAYDPAVRDPEGAPVRLEPLDLPLGAEWHAESGTLRWTPGLSDLGEHRLSVRATDAAGSSTVQEGQVGVYLPAPRRPAARVEEGGVSVSWEPVAGAAGYRIQRVHENQTEGFEARVVSGPFRDENPPAAGRVGYLVYAVDSLGRIGGQTALARVEIGP